jgi:hypothetical protein
LQEYNLRCQPPWTEAELLHKLEDADEQEGPRGYFLSKSAPGSEVLTSGFQTTFLTSAALEDSTLQLRWLVKKAVVAEQPLIIGGPKKALKTGIVIDLAISLASGKHIQNRFEVPEPVNVLVISGESGQATIRDTARRIAQAKGVDLRSCRVRWGFRLPRLTSDEDLRALRAAVIEHAIEVAILDPLYLCLLAGNRDGRQASNLFDMGPLLMSVGQTCLEAGAGCIRWQPAQRSGRSCRTRAITAVA